ncbi:MAG: M13 family peptidase [Clostridia bacterium]|nr:M13 family peptidase [Clostridia bacterium]
MENIRIQDDLFGHVNGEWIANAVIPDDRPATGGFANLSDDVEKLLTADLQRMIGSDTYPDGYLRMACRLFSLVSDTKRRNSEGFRPVMSDLKKIRSLTGISHLNRQLSEFVLSGLPLPFSVYVEEDMKDSGKRCLYISGPSTILPDTAYYAEEMKEQHDAMIGLWKTMALSVLKHARISDEERTQYVDDAVSFDAIIATLVKSNEEWSEYTKSYNPKSTRTVGTLLRPLKFRKMLEELFETVPEKISAADPRFLQNFSSLFNEETFELYKHWAYVNTALNSTPYLSEKLREAGGTFRRALTGVKTMPSVQRFAYNIATDVFSGPIGLYYGRTYFGEEAKKDVVEMVNEIIATYKKRVLVSPVLSPETREKAARKLDTMKVKMGFPDSIDKIYDRIIIGEEESLYSAMKSVSRIRRQDSFSKLFVPVDKNEWVMDGHIVNACYNPTANDITFPAGILQAPFYSIKQSRSANLGGIGAVIGHEISHAFDNNGANIDENGNLNNWWTKADFKRFEKSTKAMIKQFEGIELPWGKVNAALIVSENIADNGGMAVTLDIMSGMADADYEEYFKNWARVWCQKAKDEYKALLLNVDVHGPAVLRANMPPRNFEEWYRTFGVTSKDKMYIAPSRRLCIW